MEQQGKLLQLQNIKQRLAALPESSLSGTAVKDALVELQQILTELNSEPQVDNSRLSNLQAFVGNRQVLDPMVRKVLLGLIGKLVDNPTAAPKNVTNMDDLMGKIPGLKDALLQGKVICQLPEDFSNAPAKASNGEIDNHLQPQQSTQDRVVASASPAKLADSETAATGAEQPAFDTQELLGFFLQEASEQVEKFTDGILEMEKDGARFDLVNELFRNAHTLKGASGTMGYMSIVRITHLAEDVLDALRQGRSSVTPELIDILLNVTDRVRSIIAEIQEGGNGNGNVTDLVRKLERFLGKPDSSLVDSSFSQPRPEGVEVDLPTLPKDTNLCEVVINFVPTALMPSVRAVMVTRRLEKLGRIVQTTPSPEEIRQSNTLDFTLLLATDEDYDVITKEVLQVSEIKDAICREYVGPVELQVKKVETPATTVISQDPLRVYETKGSEPPSKLFINQTIRVPANRLDGLLNLVGEMVIARTRLAALGDELNHTQPQEQTIGELNETTVYLGRLMNELQESVMAMRMVPIGQVFSRFPRLVRDISRKTGKEADLVFSGEDTELDKTVIEAISDPLMHIVRNAIDHGLETPDERKAMGKQTRGTVKLSALHEGSHIVITVADDGRGIDLAKVKEKAFALGLVHQVEEYSDKDLANLIFLPGFSTADQISDVSGRGVGMDVVKKALVNLGGLIDIETVPGKGTTFVLRLPLTLAIIQALIVAVGQESYAIPLASVLETLRISARDIKSVGGHPIIQLRGNTLPLISLREYFELPPNFSEQNFVYVVVVGFGEKRLGLIVDDLKGQQEVVIKSLGDLLVNISGFSGATIGADGKVTLILDVGSLISDKLASIGGKGTK